MVEEWISLDHVVQKDGLNLLEIKVTYTTSSSSTNKFFVELVDRLKVSISSDSSSNRHEPTGTRIFATSNTMNEYAQFIRYLSTSTTTILSCAPYDALIWKSHSHFTLTDKTTNTTNGSSFTSYIPNEQLSSCHWTNLFQHLSKKKKLVPSQYHTTKWLNPKIWMEYDNNNNNTTLPQLLQQGISYTLQQPITKHKKVHLLWKDLIIYPITHPSSSRKGRVIHVNVHKDLVPFMVSEKPTFRLEEEQFDTSIFHTTPSLFTSNKPSMMIEMKKFIVRNHGITNHGTFQTNLYYTSTINTTTSKTLSIVEYVPTMIQPIWHTLRLNHDNTNLLLSKEKIHSKKITNINSNYYKLELSLPLPQQPSSLLTLSFDYDYTLLSYEDYPPDPNKGIPLPPSHATLEGITYYSNSVLLMTPVPDMSMPFNVVAVTSTLQIFIFACLLNFAIRKASQSISNKINNKKPKSWKQKLRAKLYRIFPSQTTKTTTSSSTTTTNDTPTKSSHEKEKDE